MRRGQQARRSKRSAIADPVKEAKKGKTEVRSHFVASEPGHLSSTTPPCSVPEGCYWVHAFAPTGLPSNHQFVGKWLIRVQCKHVDYCWGRVRRATEEGTLGIAAKVSTDWGNRNDPAEPGGWHDHVICVFTRDWQDRADLVRIARRLKEIDAVRKQTLLYKPDAMTYGGVYSRSAPGEVAVYEMKPPYEELTVRQEALELVEGLAANRSEQTTKPTQ